MLTGSPPAVTDLKSLTGALDAALSSGTPSQLQGALAAYDTSTLSESDRASPQINAKLARIAAKTIAAGLSTGRSGNPVAELKSFVIRAAVDPTCKANLKSDLDAQRVTTRNAVLDGELGELLK